MFRKIVLPLAAAALMAGCMAPYGYREGQSGDYYYGSPSVEYRHQGAYPGYGYPGYGYPGYGPYRSGLSIYGSYGSYGYPYGHGYYPRSYYGYPYSGYPYYRPVYRTRAPRTDSRPDGGGWRNWDELRRRRDGSTTPGGIGPSPTTITSGQPREPRVRRSDDGASRMGEMIRRSREGVRPSSEQEE